MKSHQLTHKVYLGVALPFMLSTMTQPLLGAMDTAVAGRMEAAAYMAGISVGSTLFNTLYWMFGFLRVSTTAFSAQAFGENAENECTLAFFRPFSLALIIGLMIIVFQKPLFLGAMTLIKPESAVLEVTKTYYDILVWGAPLVFSNYTILGWLMGQGQIKESLSMQMTGNILNGFLNFILGLYLGWGIWGIAIATLLSQGLSTMIGSYHLIRGKKIKRISWGALLDKKEFMKMMSLNSNLMKRTACLLIHNNIFIATGATFGTTVLAANGVLFQLNAIVSYMFDGLANATSVFSGRAIGQKNKEYLSETLKKNAIWTAVLTGCLTMVYIVSGDNLLRVFTPLEDVIQSAALYKQWIYLYPLIAATGLTFYGAFTGSGETRSVYTATFKSLLLFLVVWKVAVPIWGNHGLWLSLLTFYGGRSVFLLLKLNILQKKIDVWKGKKEIYEV